MLNYIDKRSLAENCAYHFDGKLLDSSLEN